MIDMRTLWAASGVQLVVAGMIAILFDGPGALASVLVGSGICLVPVFIAVGRYRAWRLVGREVTIGRMLAWQAGKWLLTAALFAAVFIGYRDVAVGWLIGGFVAAQLTTMTILVRQN